MKMRSAVALAGVMLALGACNARQSGAPAAAPATAAADTASTTCDRACLYKVLDSYLAALRAHDPARVNWSARPLHVENNVALQPGDGVWVTLTSIDSNYEMRFADVQSGDRQGKDDLRVKTRYGNDNETDITVRWRIDPKKAAFFWKEVWRSTDEVEGLLVRPMARAYRPQEPVG
jgi:hypothetical protein